MLFLLDIFKNKEPCQGGREILDVSQKERGRHHVGKDDVRIKCDVGHVVFTSIENSGGWCELQVSVFVRHHITPLDPCLSPYLFYNQFSMIYKLLQNVLEC